MSSLDSSESEPTNASLDLEMSEPPPTNASLDLETTFSETLSNLVKESEQVVCDCNPTIDIKWLAVCVSILVLLVTVFFVKGVKSWICTKIGPLSRVSERLEINKQRQVETGTQESVQCDKGIDLKCLRSIIREVAQCPICLDLLKPPVTLCVNGHGTCTACKGALTKCSICRQPYCSTEPRVLNEILQKIPEICKYYGKGCRKPATNDHELYCGFRTVKCVFHNKDSLDYCSWEGPANEYDLCHLCITEHLEPSYHDIDGPTLKFRKFKNPYPEKFQKNLFIYNFDNPEHRLFIFTLAKINGIFCLYINHFPLERPKVTFYFTLSFVNSVGEVVYQYKVKATTDTVLDRGIDIEDNPYCMRIPLEELEKLVDGAGDLTVGYKIIEEPL